MAKYNEVNYQSFIKPPSSTEEDKLKSAEKMVRDAINDYPKLYKLNPDIFGQGSYANNTNVRLNSDIDLNINISTTFFYKLPPNRTKEDFGITDSDYSFSEYKNDVYEALKQKFGVSEVVRHNKCITVIGNSYRIETDVVPTFLYKRYDQNGMVEGVKFISDKGESIKNFPRQHIANGKSKNVHTHRRFKRNVRMIKRIRYLMIENNIQVNSGITSFLLECLFWNVPNNIFAIETTWENQLKEALRFIFINTTSDEKCKDWGEVSDLLYLFRGRRKWTVNRVNEFIQQAWEFLEF